MARHYTCDRSRQRLSPDEVTILRLAGPLKSMTGRSELHLAKDQARELARWFGFTLADPPADLRVAALTHGTPAGTRPPAPKGNRRGVNKG